MNREVPIEDVLRSHPGVRDAAVQRLGDTIRAFVVPDDAYLEENLGSAASIVLGKWRKVFDLSQFMKQAAPAPVGFNTPGLEQQLYAAADSRRADARVDRVDSGRHSAARPEDRMRARLRHRAPANENRTAL